MREEYHNKLKKFFRNKLLLTRSNLNLTQEQISEKLQISVRNYANLENGKSICGTLTLVLFLIHYCPNPNEFLNELKALYESGNNELDANNI